MAYLFLKGEMAKRNITIESMAKLLEIHRNSVANKINGSSSFTIEESKKVRDAFFPTIDLDELFKADSPPEGGE